MTVVGCGSPPGPTVDTSKPDDPKERLTVSTNSARADYYSDGPVRQLVYSIKWKEAQATTLDQKNFFYKLSGVTGELYKDGKLSSTFESDTGTADQAAGHISLDGSVKVHTVDRQPPATIFCDKMAFADADRIVKASGNVHVDGTTYNFGGFDELWSSPDLKTVATPDMFPTAKPTPANDGHNLPRSIDLGNQASTYKKPPVNRQPK